MRLPVAKPTAAEVSSEMVAAENINPGVFRDRQSGPPEAHRAKRPLSVLFARASRLCSVLLSVRRRDIRATLPVAEP